MKVINTIPGREYLINGKRYEVKETTPHFKALNILTGEQLTAIYPNTLEAIEIPLGPTILKERNKGEYFFKRPGQDWQKCGEDSFHNLWLTWNGSRGTFKFTDSENFTVYSYHKLTLSERPFEPLTEEELEVRNQLI